VVVSGVKQYSEAFNRQIGQNDAVVEVDRQEVKTAKDLRKIIESKKAGDSVLFRMKRSDGSAYYAALQIQEG